MPKQATEGDGGAVKLVGEARLERGKESTLPTAHNGKRELANGSAGSSGHLGKREQIKHDSSETASPTKPKKPQPTINARKRERKIGQTTGARVPRAILLALAARYKDNHEQFRVQQQADDGGVPEGEFEIEQLLCSDADGALLVKWAGYDQPSWEPATAIPTGARESYLRQGRVELREYVALLDAAC